MVRGIRALALVCLATLVAGCETVAHKQITELKRTRPNPQILLMPLDVELSELSAGGIPEPKADWTEAARQHMLPAIRAEKEARHIHLKEYSDPETLGDKGSDSDMHVQLTRLHGIVGKSILVHQYIPALALPTKQGKFDWSLGPDVQALRRAYGADYALFIYVRDSYTSTGRAVAIFLAAALFGVAMQGGTQVGFASLVDLETGDIVWFNRLARGAGDLRTPEPAAETVRALLTNFPS